MHLAVFIAGIFPATGATRTTLDCFASPAPRRYPILYPLGLASIDLR